MCRSRTHRHKPCGCVTDHVYICPSFPFRPPALPSSSSSSLTTSSDNRRFTSHTAPSFTPGLLRSCPESFTAFPDVVDAYPCRRHQAMMDDVQLVMGPPRVSGDDDDEEVQHAEGAGEDQNRALPGPATVNIKGSSNGKGTKPGPSGEVTISPENSESSESSPGPGTAASSAPNSNTNSTPSTGQTTPAGNSSASKPGSIHVRMNPQKPSSNPKSKCKSSKEHHSRQTIRHGGGRHRRQTLTTADEYDSFSRLLAEDLNRNRRSVSLGVGMGMGMNRADGSYPSSSGIIDDYFHRNNDDGAGVEIEVMRSRTASGSGSSPGNERRGDAKNNSDDSDMNKNESSNTLDRRVSSGSRFFWARIFGGGTTTTTVTTMNTTESVTESETE